MKKVFAVMCAILLGLTFAGSDPSAAQGLPPSGGPAGYTFCANENSNCSFSDQKSVAYGANGVFNYLNLTGGTACTNAVFDDPLYGTFKACYIKAIGVTTPAPPITAPTPYSLSVPSSSVTAGANVTVTWSAPSGSQSKDWIGLYKVGDSNNSFGKWIYTGGLPSGTFATTVPETGGTYEFRYLLNDGYTDVARSSAIAVTAASSTSPPTPAPFSLSVSQASVNAGASVSVSWTAPAGRTAKDWVGLYKVGDSNNSFDGGRWTYTNGTATGSYTTSVPTTGGSYEFRYLVNDGYTDVARSNAITVTASAAPVTPPPSSGSAATYYVSSGVGAGAQAAGDDNNPGTEAQPFKTLQKAVSVLKAGGTLVVRGGEYDTVNGLTSYGGATSIPSGTSWDSPTILKAYAGEKPVFRRYMPAGAGVDEITYRDSWHMPTYAECVGAGFPNDFPNGCWDGGTTGPQEQSAYADQGPYGYVLQFSNDFPNPAQYIVIEGIDIDGRGISNMITFYAAFHIRFQSLEMRNSIKSGVSQPGLNDETLQTDLQFINVKIHHVGVPYDTNMIGGILARNHPSARFRHAWYMHTGGNSLIGSEISHAAGTALQPAGDNNIIVGNYFHDNNAGVYIDGNNWRICNNVFYNNGMIELYHRSRGSNNTICNNTLVSGPPSPYYARWGIYLSGGSAGSLYENNIILSPTGVMNNTGSVHTFRNNLIKSNPGYEYSEEYGVPVTKQSNILGQDPKLVNPANGDFRLQAGSPAIDKGNPNGLTTDHAGSPRPWGATIDIGAYEFGN